MKIVRAAPSPVLVIVRAALAPVLVIVQQALLAEILGRGGGAW